jgi:5'-deoxynucleotidase YfbR-like HD superfamily hydrolase
MEKVREAWRATLDVWKSGQEGLSLVPRWSKYVGKEQGVRPQDSLKHSYSLTILGMIFMERIRRYQPLDEAFLLSALLLHDHGEGEIGRDTLYVDKNAEGDLAEYLAFRKRYSALGAAEFASFDRAFLLQFAVKDPPGFPEDAKRVMASLRIGRLPEALVFDALERWDYVMYALEQYFERGHAKILAQVLRNQIAKLEVLCIQLHGLRDVIWTDEIAAECRAFVAAYDGKWIEQKGEK